jgi:phosphatidylglycerophosphate synthase
VRPKIPNALCWSRIVLSGFFVAVYSADSAGRFCAALGILALAHGTDQIDGRLARRWGVNSKYGSILDGLADRAMYLSVVFAFVATQRINPTIAWLVLIREFMLYGVRLMRQTEWYPITGVHRRLALLHGITLQLWFVTYFVADGVLLFLNRDLADIITYRATQSLLVMSALGVAYYYLWKNLEVVWNEHSSDH